jgi:hypothetical protein
MSNPQNTPDNNAVTLDVQRFVSDFWKANDFCNFTKEATVLFFYLIFIWEGQHRPASFYMHPASLLSKVRGFTAKGVMEASEELQQRGYIVYEAPKDQWCSGTYQLCLKKD